MESSHTRLNWKIDPKHDPYPTRSGEKGSAETYFSRQASLSEPSNDSLTHQGKPVFLARRGSSETRRTNEAERSIVGSSASRVDGDNVLRWSVAGLRRRKHRHSGGIIWRAQKFAGTGSESLPFRKAVTRILQHVQRNSPDSAASSSSAK